VESIQSDLLGDMESSSKEEEEEI